MAPTVKKTKFSKRNKKSWRHTDIKDVENFYEDQLLEERLGGSVGVKPDSELFVIQKEGEDVASSTSKKGGGLVYKSARERKKRAQQPPRCFQSLENTSKVEDPISKRNRVRTQEERKSSIQKDIERKLREKGIIKKKELIAAQNRKLNLKKLKLKPKLFNFKKDAWKQKQIAIGKWVEEDVARHYLTHTGQFNVKVPKSTHVKPSQLPNIEMPHPGTSYNPTRKAHKELVEIVRERQMKWKEEAKRLNRVTRGIKNISQHQAQSDWMAEFASALDNNEKEGDEGDDGEYRAVNPPAPRKKKPLNKRKKAKLLRKEEIEKKNHLVEKKKLADVYKLKFIERDIVRQEEESAFVQEKRKEEKAEKKFKTKLLGPTKYSEPKIDYSNKKVKNLRKFEPVGSILTDRFYSLQKRNIIEPRIRVMSVPKKNVKKYFKKGYKMDEEAELKKYME